MKSGIDCPVCGREMLICGSNCNVRIKYFYWVECYIVRGRHNHLIEFPHRKTKRGAISAATRIIEKMKGKA